MYFRLAVIYLPHYKAELGFRGARQIHNRESVAFQVPVGRLSTREKPYWSSCRERDDLLGRVQLAISADCVSVCLVLGPPLPLASVAKLLVEHLQSTFEFFFFYCWQFQIDVLVKKLMLGASLASDQNGIVDP